MDVVVLTFLLITLVAQQLVLISGKVAYVVNKTECKKENRQTFLSQSLKTLVPQHNRLDAAPIGYLQDFNVSWGQAGEDYAIYLRFFQWRVGYNKNSGRGFFVEMGGLDGVTFSNSFLYEQTLGWNGMLVEAQLDNFKIMQKTRPCTINVWSAACDLDTALLAMSSEKGATFMFLLSSLPLPLPCQLSFSLSVSFTPLISSHILSVFPVLLSKRGEKECWKCSVERV